MHGFGSPKIIEIAWTFAVACPASDDSGALQPAIGFVYFKRGEQILRVGEPVMRLDEGTAVLITAAEFFCAVWEAEDGVAGPP